MSNLLHSQEFFAHSVFHHFEGSIVIIAGIASLFAFFFTILDKLSKMDGPEKKKWLKHFILISIVISFLLFVCCSIYSG
ncbi:MAG: hypothetical protein AAFZ15_08850 [Bacteroidota bacterium]